MAKLSEAQEFAVKLTRYLASQYDVANLTITFGNDWATWTESKPTVWWEEEGKFRIHFGAKCLLHYTKKPYKDYVKCQWIWEGDNPSNSLSAVHHLILHEFAHILADRECNTQTHEYTRYSRGGRRIFHGKHFQSHLEELAIICPFEDIEHKFYLTIP